MKNSDLILIFLLLYNIISTVLFIISLNRKTKQFNNREQQYLAKIENIRKEHLNVIDNMKNEMLRMEQEKSKQWEESEKETNNILKGISSILELGEKLFNIESNKILDKLEELQKNLENYSNTINSILKKNYDGKEN